MKRNRRWIWLLIAALIMSTCVSACGSSGSEADEENRKEEADVDSDTREDDSSDGGFFSQFSFGRDKEPAEGDGASVTLEDGSVVFVPGADDIVLDQSSGIRYIRGMILAYTTASPDEALQNKLAGEVGGRIMGVQNGLVPLVEIRTDAADYEELLELCEKLATLPEVTFADPEVELEIGLETVNTLEEDPTPWSDDGNMISDKGDENHPGGNDWWAEVIHAYSAWEATPRLLEPIPVGIIDNGLDADHPEFSGRAFVINLNEIFDTKEDEKKQISHGTFVTGIAAASGSNNLGIRGLADRSDIYFMDNYNKNYYTYLQGSTTLMTYTSYPSMVSSNFSYMHHQGVRVVNHSFGSNTILTPEEYRTVSSDEYTENQQVKDGISVYDNYEDYYSGQILIGKASAKWLLNYMLMELINGYDKFLYIQSAGNGSMIGGVPVSSDLNLYFCSITEDMFNDQVLQLKNGAELTSEQQERLEKLKWDDVRDHYMIVGGAASEQRSETEYAPYKNGNAGTNIDICAPAVDVFGINAVQADTDKQYITETGTSVAAPMVSGAATLLWSVAPELPASEIKKILTECTDKKVTDPFDCEHPLLNVGLAVEYTRYYMFVRDIMIPKYGLQKGAQDGTPQTSQESWLKPEGIVTAWIGDMDSLTGSEMVVFRFEKDPDSDYSNRLYNLMLDLFTIEDGEVRIKDTLKTGFSLSEKYTMDLEMNVSSAPQGDWTDIVIEIDENEPDLYGSDRHFSWVVTSDGQTLTLQDVDASAYASKDRIFSIANENNRADKARDYFEFRVVDGCRLTWYLDFVFTDRDYIPAGYVSEYAPADGQTVVGSDQEVIQSVLWSNPPNTDDEPRLVRTEDYEDGMLKSFDQYAYDKEGLLVYKGYFHKEGDLSSIIRYEYDDAGGMIRESEILANGKTDYIISYDNDDRGNRIKKYSVPEGGGEITDWNEYEYDNADNQIRWLGYRNKELEFYWEYTYDAYGNETGWARYKADGTLTQSEQRVYDAAGHILSSHARDVEGDHETDTTYEWSDNFHTRRSPWYYSNNGSLAGYDIYTFDDYGNTLSFVVQEPDGTVSKERYYYYDDGTSGENGAAADTAPEADASGMSQNSQDAEAGALSGLFYDFAGNGNDPGNLYRHNAIGFFGDYAYFCDQPAGSGQLSIFRIPLNSGAAERITDLEGSSGALNYTFGEDGFLYFTAKNRVFRVPVDGGAPELLLELGPGANSILIGGFTLYEGQIYLSYNDGGTGGFSRLVKLDPTGGGVFFYSLGNNDLGADNVIWGSEKGLFSAHVYGGQVMLYPWSDITESTAIREGEIDHHDIEHTSFRVKDGDACMIGSDARAIRMEDGSVGIFEYEGRLFGSDEKKTGEPDRILYNPVKDGQTEFFDSQYMFELSGCYVGAGVNRGKVETYDKSFQLIESTGEVHPISGEGQVGKYGDHVYYLSIEPKYANSALVGKEYALYVADKDGHIEKRPVNIG